MRHDLNDMAYWFPRLQASGVPVPRTVLVPTAVKLIRLLDGQTPEGYALFLAELEGAVQSVGGPPCFLRTGQGSGKHQWRDTCHLTDTARLPQNVFRLVEWSECVDFLGLPTTTWAVRELLPTKPLAYLPCYGGMPLVPELRVFVGGGEVLCAHDYWPLGAIRDGLERDGAEEPESVRLFFEATVLGEERDAALALARSVAVAFAGDGEWSVDLLPTEKGWYVTDMAIAADSFHLPGCPRGPAPPESREERAERMVQLVRREQTPGKEGAA